MNFWATARKIGLLFSVVLFTACGSGGGSPGVIAVPAPGGGATPPTIIGQPAPQTILDGNSARFSVAASGSGSLSYQWKRNGAPIIGATAPSYATPALTVAENGANFNVEVSNAGGTTASSSVSVTVQPVAPVITAQPSNLVVATGQDAMFSVTVAGSATLQYQWQRNGADIAGATAASYTLPSAASGDDGATFRVVVTNVAGSVTSSGATLTVAPPGAPVLVGFLRLALAGERQAFSIVATLTSGTPPFTYQWLRNGVAIPGASGSTNSNQIAFNTPQLLAADNGVRYRLEVSNANGAASGNEVMFSVVGAPAVLGGDAHTLARSDSGSVFAWGDNSAGQLGLGDNQARLEPITVPGLSGVLAVAAGRAHSLALRADGSVVAWGANAQGQLGVGTQTNHNTPQTVSGLANVVAITAAGDQSFAVRNDGTVWAWGNNDSGQLGDGSNTDRLHPVQLTSLSGAGVAVTSVAASATHTLAVDQLGNVWAWGDNSAGQQGDTAVTVRHTPVQVAGVSGVASAAAGSGFSMAIDLNARLFAWGRNDKGQLGDGGTSNRATPQQITTTAGGGAMPVVVRIAAGNDHALALPFFGAPLAWGSNANGQLGNNAVGGTRSAPGAVSGTPSGLRTVAAGSSHSLVRAEAGSVYAWGSNSAGQIGNGASGSAVTQPVPAGNNFLLN